MVRHLLRPFAFCALLAAPSAASAEEVEMLGGLVRMDVPEEFIPMPPDLLRAKFPGLASGSDVFSSLTGDATVGAHLSDVPFPDDVAAARPALAAALAAARPDLRWLENGLVAANGRFWIRCAFVSPGPDGESRTDMLATSAGGKLLLISVSAPADADAEWRGRVEEMLRSVILADGQDTASLFRREAD